MLFRIVLISIITFIINIRYCNAEDLSQSKPKIAFSFDDGNTIDCAGYKFEKWNQMLIAHLENYKITAALFFTGRDAQDAKRKYLLDTWNNAGQKIANHTFSHQNYNSKRVTIEDFKLDFLKNDSIINQYSNYFKFFRFPYLKEGNTTEKIQSFRTFLNEQHYFNGYVSIDASDWYYNSRLIERLDSQPNTKLNKFEDLYIDHIYNRALFYDSLAENLTNRKISHVVLLHHNLINALFLGDLIQYFIDHGWEITNIEDAYKDSIYKNMPDIVPAGESIIWSLAKASGKYESILRYPAEDGDYEKEKIDSLKF